MTEWFCHAKPDLIGHLVVMDVRPGGRYGFDLSDANEKVFKVRGEYLEIKVPEKLVFTWHWETEPEYADTLVTLEFVDLGDKSELIVRTNASRRRMILPLHLPERRIWPAVTTCTCTG